MSLQTSTKDSSIVASSTNDISIENSTKIKQILDIFPTKSSSEIITIINQHPDSSVDALIEFIFDSESKPSEYPLEVYKLFEIMPDLSLEHINNQYQLHHQNFDSTLNSLVGMDKPSEHHDYNVQELWTHLEQVTCKDDSIPKKYLQDNEGDYIRALIQLVSNEVKADDPQTSRVQRRRAKVNIDQIYKSDPRWSQLDFGFCKKLMTVLGDVDQVLQYVNMIVDFGYQELTFHKQITGPILAERHVTNPKKISSIKLTGAAKQVLKEPEGWQEVKRDRPKAVEPFQTHSFPLSSHTSVNQYLQSGKLDLHGLTADAAVSLVARVTTEWWNQELEGRLSEGKRTYTKKAEIMEPLRVVTGRGIHSREGYSKIKVQVGKYLNARGFVFEEDPGSYTVIGKR